MHIPEQSHSQYVFLFAFLLFKIQPHTHTHKKNPKKQKTTFAITEGMDPVKDCPP